MKTQQKELINSPKQEKPKLTKKYSKGSYNKSDAKEQWIRITEGCPNKCVYCRESFENGTEPIYHEIPEIERNHVKIMDMNLLYKPWAKQIIETLGSKKVNGKVVYYELICGVDFRYLTQELADALKQNRFVKIRWAWDYRLTAQYKMKDTLKMLLKAGYRADDLSIFILCNWKIPFQENLRKLELLKVWNVKVSDCWFDNQTFPNVKPIHWTIEQCKEFRRTSRRHNHIVLYKIDPKVKGGNNGRKKTNIRRA